MTERNRAWRRRETRHANERGQEAKTLFLKPFLEANLKPDKEHKKHRHGALTHAQDLRVFWSTEQELRDAA